MLGVYLIVIMIFAAILLLVLSEKFDDWTVTLFKYLVLLNLIIPISVRVNLEFSKVLFSKELIIFILIIRLQNDSKMPDTLARNSNIPEELG